MAIEKITNIVATVAAAAMLVATGVYFLFQSDNGSNVGLGAVATEADAEGTPSGPSGGGSGNPPTIDLTDSQLASVKVAPVEERQFPMEKEAIGSINFNEYMTLQVFTPYQGRIIALFAGVGDDVRKGQTLFTVDSPDLLQAESTLIAAAGVLDLTTRNLARLKEL